MKNVFALTFLILGACASQTSPTGGPKDETPPKLIRSNPADQSLNFDKLSLELTFDEYVKLQNQKEEIIITPTISKPYEIQARKNKVFLTFPEPLEEKTTYTINFREAIRDITESNPAENLKITFSTGEYIDSLSISGKVYDLLGYDLGDNITVGLQRDIDTLDIFNHKPLYFTKIDKQGAFKLENLRPAAYRLYAFNDQNKNLKIDSKSEPYGFVPQIIQLENDLDNFNIPLQKLDARELKVTATRQSGTTFGIRLSKGIRQYNLSFEGKDSLYVHHPDEHNTLIKIYPKTAVSDSTDFRLTAVDSTGQQIDSLLRYKMNFEGRRIKDDFNSKSETALIYQERSILEKVFQFNKPLKSINFDSLFFRIDSLTKIHFTIADIIVDSSRNHLTLRKELGKEIIDSIKTATSTKKSWGQPYHLYIKKGAFVSIENDSLKLQTEKPKITNNETTSTIIVQVETAYPKYIVQIIDSRNRVAQEQRDIKTYSFRYLTPGEYRIRVLIDKNENGIWDPGNYFKNLAPEPVHIYQNDEGSEIIKILANWEIGPIVLIF